MKAYLIITGTIYGLLALLHVRIAFTERDQLTTNPGQFLSVLALGVLSGALAVWAWRLLRQQKR